MEQTIRGGQIEASGSHCGKKKHTRETCFELHGYPEWWQEKKAKNHSSSGPFRGGRAAAAIAGGEGAPITTIGSNQEAANNRSGNPGTEGMVVGVASIARGRGGENSVNMGEMEVEAPNLVKGNLAFGVLFSDPQPFTSSYNQPQPSSNTKCYPPDLEKL